MPSLMKIRDKVFYGWVITFAGFIILLMSVGIRNSFGVFFKSIEIDFGLTRGSTSTISSVYMLISCIFGFLGGWAMDRYGPRIVIFLMGSFTGLGLLLTSQTNSIWQLYITYGLLLSIGTSATFAVVITTVSRWFIKKRGFAFGITSSGGSAGLVVVAPFSAYIISHFEWRTAFIILGIASWLLIASLSLLLRKDPGDIGLLPDGERPGEEITQRQIDRISHQPDSLSLLETFKTAAFWFLVLCNILFSLSVNLVLIHIVPHAIDLGVSATNSAIILSLMGLAAISGRLITGRVSDKTGRKAPAIICALFQVIITIWLIWIQDLLMFYLFAIIFGFSWGGLGNQISSLTGDTFGAGNMGAIMGTMLIGWFLGAAIGPALGGFIFDASGTYVIAFIIGALSMLFTALFIALIKNKTVTE